MNGESLNNMLFATLVKENLCKLNQAMNQFFMT